MSVHEEEKSKIVQGLLSERYVAEHKMRERSASFTIWILGVGIALLWILLTKVNLALHQKIIICFFIVSYSALSLWFLSEICRGFKTNHAIIIKLEDFLGLYSKSTYLENDTILPTHYREPYARGIPSHFRSLYALIIVLAIFLVITVIFIKPPVNDKTLSKDTQAIGYGHFNKGLSPKPNDS